MAAAGLGIAAPNSDADLFRKLNSPWLSGWALADFDGDQQADLATATPGHSGPQGYSHHISLKLSGAEPSSFSIRNAYARVQLSARDMDGDRDRDLVVLEASSMRPVGIWINDGSGHFEEGDLADFSRIFKTQPPAAIHSHSPGGLSLAITVQPALHGAAGASDSVAIERLSLHRPPTLTPVSARNLRSRAPPAL